MKKLNRNQWIAVTVALVVIITFFATGRTIISFFSNGEQVINQEQTTMDSTQPDSSNLNNAFSTSIAGFEITDITVGTGEVATAGKKLTVNYSGALTDGRVFDSSYTRGTPFEFTLGAGDVIQGWDKGFAGMKVGGKRRLVIPGELAYGSGGVPGLIPSNATLVFEVELLGVK